MYVPLIYLDVFFLFRIFSKGFSYLACVRIPSRAESTDDFDWLEFARCAADFGPLGPSTSATAVDRLRLALKHYVLQTLGAVQEATKEVEAKTMKNVMRMFNNCLIMMFIDLRSPVLLLSLG